MGLLTDAGLDSGAYRNRLLSSTNGLSYWDETVGRRQFAWDTVNNRWQLVYGDTGIRDVSALCVTGTAAIYLRRVGSTVYLNWRSFAPGSTGNHTLINLPVGFAPSVTKEGVAGDYPNTRPCTVASTVVVYGVTGAAGAGNLVYEVTAAWPALLPGTASGAIPFA